MGVAAPREPGPSHPVDWSNGSALVARELSGRHRLVYLLGERGMGWWYYFPVAYLFKTPVGFQALLVLALVGFWGARADRGGLVRLLLGGPLRAPFAALVLFGAGLLTSTCSSTCSSLRSQVVPLPRSPSR